MGESTRATAHDLPSAETKTPLEALSAVCQCLLQLEDESAAPGLIDVAAGGLLRIAGESKAAGWTDAAGLCELGDQILKAIHGGNLTASSPVIDALLEMCEALASMAAASEGKDESCGVAIAPLTEKLQQLLKRATAAEPPALPAGPPIPSVWPAPGTGLVPDMVAEFKTESTESLQMLEAVLLKFERTPHDADCVHVVFRVIHNIKGVADYVGLAQIKTLSHRLEDLLDLLRAGRCETTEVISDLVFRSVDELKAMITSLAPDAEQDRDLTDLVTALAAANEAATRPPAPTCPAVDSSEDRAVYVESAEQQLGSIAASCRKLIEGNSSEPVLAVLNRGAATLGTAAASLGEESLAALTRELMQAVASLRESRCQTRERFADSWPTGAADGELSLDSIFAGCEELIRGSSSDAILTVLKRDLTMLSSTAARLGEMAVAGAAETFVQGIDAFWKPSAFELQLARISSVGVPGGGRDPEYRQPAPPSSPMQGETFVPATEFAASSPATEPATQHRERPTPSPACAAAAAKTMRVDQGKLDDYVNLAGELVIARNALVHEFGQCRIDAAHHHRLKESVERVQRIVADIQANAMSMRMVPVMSVFQRFPRMVRDIAKAQGKQIEIKLFGEETELDRQVAEKLGDPLVHLIRNSADHGIELPEVRRAAGKNESGLITLKAGREGSSIIIDIIDDGRGIDVARLKAKAVEKGILRQEQADAMSREKALELIFAAGLSTAKVVSDISGRGVGMDVVRSNITDLGGTVSVLSEDGKGSQLRLHLPLTLAVTTVVLVSARNCLYAIPMESVRETVKVLPENVRTLNGRYAFSLRNRIVPIVSLADVLSSQGGGRGTVAKTPGGLTTDRSGRVPIAVVATRSAVCGISVDELRGQQEIVIKPLPSQLGQLPGIGGATIMGDGSVVLILDPASLYDFVMTQTDSLFQGRQQSPAGCVAGGS